MQPDQCQCVLSPIEDAISVARPFISKIETTETLPIGESAGRQLSRNFRAKTNDPQFNQSTMDGYAQCGHVHDGNYVLSGHQACDSSPLEEGQAQLISAGGRVPVGADRVVLERYALRRDGEIAVARNVGQGTSIRLLGEDVREGDQLMVKGTRLDARKISVLAAQKIELVCVQSRLRIAYFSITKAPAGQSENSGSTDVFDGNRLLIREAVECVGAEFVDGGRCYNNVGDIGRVISFLSRKSDMIVFCAESSAAENEIATLALIQAGATFADLHIAMKPGKPTTVGTLNNTAILKLPSYPFATFVSWFCIGRSMIEALMGSQKDLLRGRKVACVNGLKRRSGKVEFAPVKQVQDTEREMLEMLGGGGSARLIPLSRADGLAFIDAKRGDVQIGEKVTYLPF